MVSTANHFHTTRHLAIRHSLRIYFYWICRGQAITHLAIDLNHCESEFLGMIQREKLGCIGQYGVIFGEQLLGYPPQGYPKFPFE